MTRAVAAGVTLAAMLALQGCAANTACTAEAYVYVGPVELAVPGHSPTTAEVLACFGEGCTPVPAEPSGQIWELNIGDFYERGGPEHPAAVLAVVIAIDTGKELARDSYPIEYKRTDGGGRCPGPIAPEPVVIAAGSN